MIWILEAESRRLVMVNTVCKGGQKRIRDDSHFFSLSIRMGNSSAVLRDKRDRHNKMDNCVSSAILF